jgi:hypothetical protein
MGRRILFSIWLTVGGIFTVAQSQQELFVDQLQSAEAFKAAVLHGAVSSKANLFAAVAADKSLKIFDLGTLAEKTTVANFPTQINTLSFSASGQSRRSRRVAVSLEFGERNDDEIASRALAVGQWSGDAG